MAHPKIGSLGKPFGNCVPPKLGNVVARLPCTQAKLGEDSRSWQQLFWLVFKLRSLCIIWNHDGLLKELWYNKIVENICNKIVLLHGVFVHPVSSSICLPVYLSDCMFSLLCQPVCFYLFACLTVFCLFLAGSSLLSSVPLGKVPG